MSNVNPPFENLSLDPAEMVAVKEATTWYVERFRTSANWKWIAKSSPEESCEPQKPASGTPTHYASVPSMD